jgi:transcriptional regulator with XRE-family HTH domain
VVDLPPLGERVRYARELLGLTREELADRTEKLTHFDIQDIEEGTRDLGDDVDELALLLSTTPADLWPERIRFSEGPSPQELHRRSELSDEDIAHGM